MSCPREGRLIGGCKFQARYDAKLPSALQAISVTLPIEAIYAMKDRVYIRDVCTRCGKTIERDEA